MKHQTRRQPAELVALGTRLIEARALGGRAHGERINAWTRAFDRALPSWARREGYVAGWVIAMYGVWWRDGGNARRVYGVLPCSAVVQDAMVATVAAVDADLRRRQRAVLEEAAGDGKV